MQISHKGLTLIKSFEGCKLRAYLCPAKVWTIGYGSTGKHVKPGMVITKEEAEDLLKRDLVRFESGVLNGVSPIIPNQEEFDAMVSLSFNIGIDAFKRSSVCRLFKAGKKPESANAFGMWVKAGGRTLPGLVRRRAAEKELFLSGTDHVERRKVSVAKFVDVPQESVVPDAPKKLVASREILLGGSLGLGGVFNFLDNIGVDDLMKTRDTIESVGKDAETNSLMQTMHIPEVSSVLVVVIGVFMVWKRFTDRKNGIR